MGRPYYPLSKQKIEDLSFKEPNTGCWLWERTLNHDGYGIVYDHGKIQYSAHRAAWILWRGQIPDGMCVLHKCDTPPCCNPDHLFLGTKADNNIDKKNKGRAKAGPPGEGNHNAKLSNADAIKIFNDKRPLREIAAEYGVTMALVSYIRTGKTWAKVTGGVYRQTKSYPKRLEAVK